MLDERDVHPLRVPSLTRPARSTVDLASWSERPRYARAVVLAAVQQRLVRASDVRDALSRRGRCRHRGLIIESVLDAAGGIQSLPERDFDQIRARVGLPPPSRQVRMRGDDGRYYLDVAWLEDGIACEIHGIPHRDIVQWDNDLMRANEIVIAGPRLLIFSSYAIRHEPEVVGDQLVRLFRRSGSQPRL
ncbi:hypothetical protein [Mumia flava]|nr:hypothetical protein [Mumia flava]